MKTLVQVQVGSLVILDCKPRASPRALSFWKKGDMMVREQSRYSVLPNMGLLASSLLGQSAKQVFSIKCTKYKNFSITQNIVYLQIRTLLVLSLLLSLH